MAYPQSTFAAVTIDGDSLIGRRRQAACTNTLLYQLSVLKKTGRYTAFRLGWHPVYDEEPEVWPIPNHLFWDSDVAKWIEGACYFLKQQSLPEVDAAVQDLVEMIRSAQQPDGYVNVHYTVVAPGKRFTNLRDMHELYNAGHLIEAALAHEDLYHNDRLLEPIMKYVDLLCATFGPEPAQICGYPGHPEIELALLRLFDRTKESRYQSLARYFICERGNPEGVAGQNYFDWEAAQRGDDPAKRAAYYPAPRCLWYHQAHEPIMAQRTVEGHSVRAMYLLTAVADLARLETNTERKELTDALYRLWDNMVDRKMYLTGGIGSMKQWEGFGPDFFLPQATDEGGCYAETCAAIGVMMLAQRMLQLDEDSKYADIMELCLYNSVLTSMSSDGKAFTYVNQLASSDSDPSSRRDWFTVACCPPNILRLLGQIGGYVWNHKPKSDDAAATLSVNLYVPSSITLSVGEATFHVTQTGQWPWDDTITFSLEETAADKLEIRLRIPVWCVDFQLEPTCRAATLNKGYLTIPREWLAVNRKFQLKMPLRTRWIAPDPRTGQDTVSLARGPVIYCVEDFDNPWVVDHFKSTFVSVNAQLTEIHLSDETRGDHYVAISLVQGARVPIEDEIKASPSTKFDKLREALEGTTPMPKLNFIPFCLRANRGGKGQSRVGLKRYP